MNACVLDPRDTRVDMLDLARRYRIRCIVRLAGKGGKLRPVSDRIANHAAILTYMIGDEPKLHELAAYRRALEAVAERYPGHRPVTATIFDGWGLGSEGDPDIIFNHALADLPLQRFGRLCCFRQLDYGLLRHAEPLLRIYYLRPYEIHAAGLG